MLTKLHFVSNVAHFGSKYLAQTPIFGIVRCHSADLVSHNVGDFSAELQIALIRVFVTLVFADDFFILIGHTFMSPI